MYRELRKILLLYGAELRRLAQDLETASGFKLPRSFARTTNELSLAYNYFSSLVESIERQGKSFPFTAQPYSTRRKRCLVRASDRDLLRLPRIAQASSTLFLAYNYLSGLIKSIEP